MKYEILATDAVKDQATKQDNWKTKELNLKIESEIKLISTDEGQYFQVCIYNTVDAVLRIARLSVLKCIKEARVTHSDECYTAFLCPDESFPIGYVKNAIDVAMRKDIKYDLPKAQHEMIKEMLEGSPNPMKLYDDSVTYLYGIDSRAALDTLRLCIEQLMKETLGNSKPLEKQKDEFGKYLKSKGLSSEIRTQAVNTLDCFTKYQNNNVKHNFKGEYLEIDFVFSMGESLIKVLKL